jgi:hypothetical protein
LRPCCDPILSLAFIRSGFHIIHMTT